MITLLFVLLSSLHAAPLDDGVAALRRVQEAHLTGHHGRTLDLLVDALKATHNDSVLTRQALEFAKRNYGPVQTDKDSWADTSVERPMRFQMPEDMFSPWIGVTRLIRPGGTLQFQFHMTFMSKASAQIERISLISPDGREFAILDKTSTVKTYPSTSLPGGLAVRAWGPFMSAAPPSGLYIWRRVMKDGSRQETFVILDIDPRSATMPKADGKGMQVHWELPQSQVVGENVKNILGASLAVDENARPAWQIQLDTLSPSRSGTLKMKAAPGAYRLQVISWQLVSLGGFKIIYEDKFEQPYSILTGF